METKKKSPRNDHRICRADRLSRYRPAERDDPAHFAGQRKINSLVAFVERVRVDNQSAQERKGKQQNPQCVESESLHGESGLVLNCNTKCDYMLMQLYC